MDSAVILAAGFGSRFVPLTFETPKGLLEVYGERMIERQIKQLHEAGVTDITIVVGYLKEKFEYLIDKFGVKLLYNPEYHNKNTLTTLYRARECFIGRNTYLLSSDNWMRSNMYHTYECGAWYSSVFMKGETSSGASRRAKKDCSPVSRSAARTPGSCTDRCSSQRSSRKNSSRSSRNTIIPPRNGADVLGTGSRGSLKR